MHSKTETLSESPFFEVLILSFAINWSAVGKFLHKFFMLRKMNTDSRFINFLAHKILPGIRITYDATIVTVHNVFTNQDRCIETAGGEIQRKRIFT